MTYFSYYAFVLIASLGTFLFITLPTARLRAWAAMFFVLYSIGVYGQAFESLGHPKPTQVEWRTLDGLRIVGMQFSKKERTTYIWALRDGIPMSYSWKWADKGDEAAGEEEASKLQEKWRKRFDKSEGEFLMNESEGAKIEHGDDLPPKGG